MNKTRSVNSRVSDDPAASVSFVFGAFIHFTVYPLRAGGNIPPNPNALYLQQRVQTGRPGRSIFPRSSLSTRTGRLQSEQLRDPIALSAAGCLETFPPLRSTLLFFLLTTAGIQDILHPSQESFPSFPSSSPPRVLLVLLVFTSLTADRSQESNLSLNIRLCFCQSGDFLHFQHLLRSSRSPAAAPQRVTSSAAACCLRNQEKTTKMSPKCWLAELAGGQR